MVAPVRERGLKLCFPRAGDWRNTGRSRKGAWIEILPLPTHLQMLQVAPVRERGLKCDLRMDGAADDKGRSRKGAWIEIIALRAFLNSSKRSLP